MSSLSTIYKKELKDFARNRFFVLLFLFLAIIMVISVAIASADFRSKIADYNNYVAALHASHSAFRPQPQLFALQLLRGSIEYLELIGALFAIIIGYGMIAKEKQRGTLQLLFSRPLSKHSLGSGKVIAMAILWLLAVVGIFAVIILSLIFIGNAPLHAVDIYKLVIVAGLAWVYLLFWSCLAMGFAAITKQLSSALIITLVIWLVFVLIMPQIGDTMDPDNQVPGGLFKSLQVDRAHEQSVISHFSGYETTRNYIEVTSITKQFERPAFGYLGINEAYNQKSVGFVTIGLWPNALWLFIGFIASVGFAIWSSTKRRLLRKDV
jgi:ABC-type transport system involved in multi-copper enzyme maturation permease subunit